MTTFNLTCEAVEATLPDYLDETLEAWVRKSIEEHLGECARCAGLARELRNITREAAALPALLPEREIWPRIAGRIGAPVIVSGPVAESEPLAPAGEPLLPSGTAPVPTTAPAYALPGRREKRWGPGRMGLAAAALVLVTAGTTFLLTVQWLGPARTPNVASDTGARRLSSSERPAEPTAIETGQVASGVDSHASPWSAGLGTDGVGNIGPAGHPFPGGGGVRQGNQHAAEDSAAAEGRARRFDSRRDREESADS